MGSRKIICEPLNDRNKRFLLGKQGQSTLLAIGLNPSTANEEKLDPTSRNIERIAQRLDCDGWWLVNLYPRRTSKPSKLPKRKNTVLADENIAFIQAILQDTSYNIHQVLCCWGNHVEKYPYLQQQAQRILQLLDNLNISPQCIGLTSKKHPFHPAPMTVNLFLGGIEQVRLRNMDII